MKGISVIICSRDISVRNTQRINLEETIGCEFEIIPIDNSGNSYSIFEAYNHGIEKSVYSVLVFIHEDIILHSKNWGAILLELFRENPQYGLIGIAGSRIKTKMPSAWWESNDNVWRLIQHFKYKPKESWEQGFKNGELEEVSVIDGVFMAMRRDSKINFDERLHGFHNYDLSISLQHRMHDLKVGVAQKILIEHFSEGNLDNSWIKSTSEFHRLYKDFLPSYVDGTSYSLLERRKKEVTLGYEFINKLINQNFINEALYWWWQLFKLKPISKYHLRVFKKLILVR